jgi:hypothetical protein
VTAVSNERKHQISVELVNAMNRIGNGKATLEETLTLIDRIAESDPGDVNQQMFYEAARALAKKIAGVEGYR